jgi:hypothetical protein
MEEDQSMIGNGTLAGEIQRKIAEIDSWPAWAKPYERQTPSTPADGHTSTPAGPREGSSSAQPPRKHLDDDRRLDQSETTRQCATRDS